MNNFGDRINRYCVGYKCADEPIGIYYGTTEEEAIRECKDHIQTARLQGYKDDTLTAREKLQGMVAYLVDY